MREGLFCVSQVLREMIAEAQHDAAHLSVGKTIESWQQPKTYTRRPPTVTGTPTGCGAGL